MANSPRYVGFTSPPYNVTLIDDNGNPINLTGVAGTAFTWTLQNITENITFRGSGTWTVTNAAAGQASYALTSADVATAGNCLVYVTVQLPSESSPREFDPDPLQILVGSGTISSAPIPLIQVQGGPVNLVQVNGLPLSGNNPVPVSIVNPNVSGVVAFGGTTAVSVPGNSGVVVIKAGMGRLASAIVTTTGTAQLNIYDNASQASGIILGAVPANAAVGSVYAFNSPAQQGIVANSVANCCAVTICYY